MDSTCRQCAHHEGTSVFELCKHESSAYFTLGVKDYHTCWHMRHHGHCGKDAVLLHRKRS